MDHILSETIFLFCFCVLFSNMHPKVKFTAKNWSDVCNFYSKAIFGTFVDENIFLLFFEAIFGIFVDENIFLLFFANLNYQYFTTVL